MSLNLAYILAQGFGWNWSENLKPHEDARFAVTYTVAIAAAATLVMFADPLALTMVTMALNGAIAPFIVFPLLIVMNDKAYLRDRTNGVVSNVMISLIIIIAFAIAIVAIPLEVLGG